MGIVLVPKPHGVVLRCTRCKVEKPITEYYMRSDQNNVPQSYCIECTKAIAKRRGRRMKTSLAEQLLPLIRSYTFPAEAMNQNTLKVYGCLTVCVKKARKYKSAHHMRVFFTKKQLKTHYDMVVVISPENATFFYRWDDTAWLNAKGERLQTKVLNVRGRGSLLEKIVDECLHDKRLEIAMESRHNA